MPGRQPKISLPIALENWLTQALDRDPENVFLLTLLSSYWFLRYAAGCRGKNSSDLTVAAAASRVAERICPRVETHGHNQASGAPKELKDALKSFLGGAGTPSDYCRYARALEAWSRRSGLGRRRLRDLTRSRRPGKKASFPGHASAPSSATRILASEIEDHRTALQRRKLDPWKNRDYLIQLLGYLTAPTPLGFALLFTILISKDGPDPCASNLENLLKVYNPFLDPMIPRKRLVELYASMELEIGSISVGLEEGMLSLHMLHAWQRGKSTEQASWRVPVKNEAFTGFFTQIVPASSSSLPMLTVRSTFIGASKGPRLIALPDVENPAVALQDIELAGRKPLDLIENYFEERRLATQVAEQVFNHELAGNPPSAPPWITANLLDFSNLEALDEHRRRFLEHLLAPKASNRLREIAEQRKGKRKDEDSLR